MITSLTEWRPVWLAQGLLSFTKVPRHRCVLDVDVQALLFARPCSSILTSGRQAGRGRPPGKRARGALRKPLRLTSKLPPGTSGWLERRNHSVCLSVSSSSSRDIQPCPGKDGQSDSSR